MAFFDDLLGKSSARDARQGAADQLHYLQAGYDQAEQRTGQAYDAASARLTPYEESGRNGFNAYRDSIGLGGAEGFRRSKELFDSDPFAAGMSDYINQSLRSITRRTNAGGQSGRELDLGSRFLGQAYGDRVADFRNRLSAFGNTGLNVAGSLADMDVQRGNRLADMSIGRYGGMANIRGQEIANVAAAQQQGQNNLMKGFSTIAGLAAAPLTGGMSLTRPLASMTGGYNAGSTGGLGGSLAMGNYGNIGQSSVGANGLPALGSLWR